MQTQTTREIQPTLFDNATESRFERYNAENPAVYAAFKRFAFELINGGRTRFGANAIIERIRWQSMVRGNDSFKVNNIFAPFYARLFMRDYPQHKGIFSVRKSKADDEI